MPYKSVLDDAKLISSIATMRDALQDDHRRSMNNICEMLELSETSIPHNMRETLQRQIAFASSANEVIGAKVETLILISRLIAQFTKYEYVKEEVTEADGG